MRLALKLLRPAANQNIKSPKLWQDPVLGYFETVCFCHIHVSPNINLFLAW